MTDIEIPVGKRTKKYRFFEMLPAFLSYGLILLPILLSFISTILGALFIIAYLIFWLVKAVGIAFRTIQGYDTMQKAQKVNWRKRLNDMEDPGATLANFDDKQWRHGVHQRNLETLAHDENRLKPSQIYNVAMIATYNESNEVLEPTIESILASDYDMKHLILVIAYEARGGKEIEETVKKLIEKYGDRFYHAAMVKHPNGIPHEVIGKGGNITYAGRWLQTWLEEKKIAPEHVVVTTLDSDNRPHKTYFSYVAYEYIINPERRYVSFQPIALYMNNIWDVPAPMRVLATGNSFWTIINSLRPHMLRNFAAHSQPMSSLIDTDFWSVRTIVEDGHQFWRSYFTYDGRYDVVPIYVPIYQDAVLADGYMRTLKAQFVQLRRWAYGASDIAYVADKGFRKGSKVPFFNLLGKFVRLVDSHVSWASASVIVAFGAWAPLFLNPESSRSIVAHELPNIASFLQQVALIGLFITVFLTMRMLPPRPARYKRRRSFFMVAQWVIMPVTSAVYGVSAAFYAQTRLLFGRYLDKFDVTEKAVKKD
jgi:cellulose synthase/poly-beta-1,6-N-acetylglucosamine synthase-like glycosyltransferase